MNPQAYPIWFFIAYELWTPCSTCIANRIFGAEMIAVYLREKIVAFVQNWTGGRTSELRTVFWFIDDMTWIAIVHSDAVVHGGLINWLTATAAAELTLQARIIIEVCHWFIHHKTSTDVRAGSETLFRYWASNTSATTFSTTLWPKWNGWWLSNRCHLEREVSDRQVVMALTLTFSFFCIPVLVPDSAARADD